MRLPLQTWSPSSAQCLELACCTTREGLRKPPIELTGVDLVGNGLDDVGTTTSLVAGGAIRVISIEPAQDARASQKVVDQSVDRDHSDANFGPKAQVSGRR